MCSVAHSSDTGKRLADLSNGLVNCFVCRLLVGQVCVANYTPVLCLLSRVLGQGIANAGVAWATF